MEKNRHWEIGLDNVNVMLQGLLSDSFWESFGDLPVGIIVINQNGIIRFLNSMAGYFLHIQPALALEKPIQEIMQETQILNTLKSGIPYYNKQRSINGRLLKCSYIPIKVHGSVICGMEFMLDATEIMSMANQLKEMRLKYDFLEMLTDEAFEELGAVDKDGKITYISRKSATNLGLLREEIIGCDISTIDPKCLLKSVARLGVPQLAKISRPSKFPVPVMVVPLKDKDGEPSGAICKSIFTDMAEASEFISKLQKLNTTKEIVSRPKRISGCKYSLNDIIGKSKAILYAKQKGMQVAKGDSIILITGETGTGKELFSQAIHMLSSRKNGPFVRVNCAGIPENLLESELFGYEYGSFTGARKEGKPGKFEMANNGTIFFDEAGDMSMGMQSKLLRVIQEGEIERLGGTSSLEVNVRIICATNKNLWEMVNKGQFREDLYYRLDVVNICIPPLRERLGDIPFLIEHFIPFINKRLNTSVRGISQEVLEYFMSYDWPGNIRELLNILEGAMNLNTGEVIDIQALPPRFRKRMTGRHLCKPISSTEGSTMFMDRKPPNEKAMIEEALVAKKGNKRQAAMYLSISRSNLYNKLKTYEIDMSSLLNKYSVSQNKIA